MWFRGISWGQGRLRSEKAELPSRASLGMSLLLFTLLSTALAGPGLIQNASIDHHKMLANSTLDGESQRVLHLFGISLLAYEAYHYGDYDTKFVDTSRDLLEVICCGFGSLSYFVPGTGHVRHLAD